jgi:hypothetical protein
MSYTIDELVEVLSSELSLEKLSRHPFPWKMGLNALSWSSAVSTFSILSSGLPIPMVLYKFASSIVDSLDPLPADPPECELLLSESELPLPLSLPPLAREKRLEWLERQRCSGGEIKEKESITDVMMDVVNEDKKSALKRWRTANGKRVCTGSQSCLTTAG